MKLPLLTTAGLFLALATSHAIELPLEELESDDYAVRQETRNSIQLKIASALEEERAKYEDGLVILLDPETPLSTRIWSIRMLELFGSPEAVPYLALLLQDSDVLIRDAARKALVNIPGPESADALLSALNVAGSSDAQYLVEAVAARRMEAAVPVLAKLCHSDEPQLAISSIRALGSIGDDASVGILANLLETSAGNLRQEIELSLLQGSLNKDIAVTLATIGSNGSIRSAALQHLIRLDIEAAGGVVRAILEEPSSMDKEKLLKTALESELQNEIIKGLKGMAPMDQLVVFGFIADKRLTTHEQAVLDLLSSENETVKTGAIETLGHIGGDASLDTLLALYVEADDNDTTVMALARLNSDSIDARLIDLVNKDQGDTLSAIKILALRNPDGLTDMANQWAGSDNPGEMRSASFRALERIGNIDSVKLLLATIIAQETLSRPAQQSLIKLSVNMGIPAYQWEHAYQPALQSADNLESKKAVIAILYGISCQETAEFLAGLIASDSTLRDQALRSLIRWRNISSSTVWLDLISSPEASPDDIRNALRGISRILSQDSVKGDDKAKVQLAVEAIEKAPNAQFKQDILAIYEDPDFDFESSDRRAIKDLFPDLVEDPDIGPAAQAILDHVLEMD